MRERKWEDAEKAILGKKKISEEEIHLEMAKLTLAQAIYSFRKKKGLSQIELAKRMSVKQQVISRVESGEANMTIDTLFRFLEALGIVLKVEKAKSGRLARVLEFEKAAA